MHTFLIAAGLLGCSGAADKGAAATDSAATEAPDGGGDSAAPGGEAGGETGGAGGSGCAALALSASFDVDDQPTTAWVRAALPEGLEVASAELSYSDGTFRYGFELDPARVIDGGDFRWLQPFPAGASIALSLSLTGGGQSCSAELAFAVPEVDADTFPPLESTWTYEAYPRPVYVTTSMELLSPDGATQNAIVLTDHLGRYLWSYPIEAPRAFATADGVLLLPLGSGAGESGTAPLTFIGWDGRIEELGVAVEDFHHDFYLEADRQSVVALSYERLEDVQDACGWKQVLGDVIVAADTGGSEGLWRTSEDYPSRYYADCAALSDKSVSYLNGVSAHDGVLSASSSPVDGPAGLVIGYERGGGRDFLYLSDRSAESDIPMSYQPGCPSGAFSAPHGSICEASAEGEVNCLVHNRHGQDECDSLAWIRVTQPGEAGAQASCLVSTTPEVLPASPDCGNSVHHGTFEWLDGRIDDPEGLFGVDFSPAGAFMTGIRADRAEEPTLTAAFRILDPNADTMNQDSLGAPCVDGVRPCISSGRFHTLSMGLGERWALAADP